MTALRILIVDADPLAAASLRSQLGDLGFEVAEAATADGRSRWPPASSRRWCCSTSRRREPRDRASSATCVPSGATPRVLVVSGESRGRRGRWRRCAPGADGWLVRPVQPDRLGAALERAGERRALRLEIAGLRERIRGRLALIGTSPELVAVFELVRRVAPTKATILLHGESGSGKHHLAQVVHELSPRRERPFVAVNCAGALARRCSTRSLRPRAGRLRGGRPSPASAGFEEARGGTLYLHEVGRLLALACR